MVEAWFDLIASQKYRPGPQARRALQDFFNGRIPSDEAARRVTTTILTLPDEKIIQVHVGELWDLLIDAAKEIPGSQDKLVRLLAAIGGLPDFVRRGKIVEVAGDGGRTRLWRDLPMFADLMRDEYYEDLPPTHRGQPQLEYEWVNFNAFAARLVAEGICDLKSIGINSLHQALEDEPWKRSPPLENVRERDRELVMYRRTVGRLNSLVPAAAQWIFHAGRMIFHLQDEWKASQGPGDDQGSGESLWKGKNGFCRERWGFWKSRFAWVHGLKELEFEAKAIAKRAVEIMEKIEKNPETEFWQERIKQGFSH